MSEKEKDVLEEFSENLLTLKRAPSQYNVFYNLLISGKTMTVKEMASELQLTDKATERAMAKLYNKGLIERSPFRDGGYTIDTKKIILSLMMMVSDLYEDYRERKG
jgi:predicted transcriptional regulator